MKKEYERIYLIDCENIGYSFYSSPNDLIYYFTNSSVKELPFICNENEIHMCFNHNGCKDALDFILDTYLGYLIKKYGENTEYFIISNDKGYDNISAFWQSLGYKVYTNPHKINKALNEANTKNNSNAKHVDCDEIIHNLSSQYKTKINNIINSWLMSKAKEKRILLQELNRCLQNTLEKKEIKIICDYYYNNYI